MNEENRSYYAIVTQGYGSRTRYQIRKIYKSGLSIPVTATDETWTPHKTESAARAAAAAAGIEISVTGDYYEILARINNRL